MYALALLTVLRLLLVDCPVGVGALAKILWTGTLEPHYWTVHYCLESGSSTSAPQGYCSLAIHAGIVDTAAGCSRLGRIESFSFGMTGTLCMCV
jgi:MFS superfamily sulfate permease-like transporter